MLAAPKTVTNRTMASADEYPVRHFSKAARFKVMETSLVVEPGPPEVSKLTMSNILKFSMARNRTASIRNGVVIGRVIDQNCRQDDARSASGGSWWYPGIGRPPACQTSMH